MAMSFEQSLNRIEEIVLQLEKGDLPLNESLSLFEEGTGLIVACNKHLDEAEQIVVRLAGGSKELPFNTEFDEEC